MKATRIKFICGVGFMGLAALALCAQESRPQTQPSQAVASIRAKALPTNVVDGFTISTVGDLIIQHPESMRQDAEFQGVVQILKSSDVTFGNMEGTIGDPTSFQGYPEGKPEGSFFLFDPAVARDLKAIGFTMVGRANNHTTDWGIEGMMSTDHLLDLAGVVHAGTGRVLGEARAARYQETPKGRVALVSMTSAVTMGSHMPTDPDDESAAISAAAAAVGAAPGRPGLNALRITPYVLVTQADMDSLHAIRDSMPKGSAGGGPGRNPNEMTLFGVRYRLSDHAGYVYEPDPQSLKEILQSIRNGKEDSNFLIASIHSHDPGNWSVQPADFQVALAHAAIDNGADVFVGHGPHRLRGIEIYKGKPIFYSLGNFFFEESMQQPIPEDVWDQTGIDPRDLTEAELAGQRFSGRGVQEYQTVIATTRFEHGQVAEIRLYPVFLGAPTDRDADHGVPHMATPAMAQTILETLQQLSKPFGTTIEIQGNVGLIHVPASGVSAQPNGGTR